jgi:predicted MPP superfamily phosphohydrolase
MFTFLFLYISYGLANLYVFLKLKSIADLGLPGDLFLGLIILFLTLSPTLIQISNFRGTARAASFVSHTGYMWLALLIPFITFAIVLELYNSIMKYGGLLFSTDLNGRLISSGSVVLISFGLSLAITVYGYFEAKRLCIERLTVRTSKLPGGIEKIRVAQIADLHLGLVIKDKILNRVIEIIDREKPDMVVSTGDLVDGVVHHIEHFAERLKAIRPRLGKFAVLGNHEIYGGITHTARFIRDSGFTLLRGEGTTVKDIINIAGVDFTGGEAKGLRKDPPEKKERDILSELPRDKFTLLLKHRSDIEEKSLGLFDLQLSGHTHKGQIFPMNLAILFVFQHISGLTRLLNGSAIYVSRGAGTAGPPVRVFAKPEVTIIDIVSV